MEYYLWGAVKDKCYADKSETIEALKDNISEAIAEIKLHTIDNVMYIVSPVSILFYRLLFYFQDSVWT